MEFTTITFTCANSALTREALRRLRFLCGGGQLTLHVDAFVDVVSLLMSGRQLGLVALIYVVLQQVAALQLRLHFHD